MFGFLVTSYFAEKLSAGYHSTKGIGKTEPDPAVFEELDGAKVFERFFL